MNYQITGLTLAVTNMQQMLEFYEGVFQIRFTMQEMQGHQLYKTKWLGMDLLFCPAELANNTATQNRHQFDIATENIIATVELVQAHHGIMMHDIIQQGDTKTVSVYDPDHNSMVFTETTAAS